MPLDLLDELPVSMFPYVAGRGTRLFEGARSSYALELVSCTASSGGTLACGTGGGGDGGGRPVARFQPASDRIAATDSGD